MVYSGLNSTQEKKEKAESFLELVGISEKLKSKTTELSGGQQQRVAIARAIINDPLLIMADEPTGALDSVIGQRIIALLQKTCKKMGTTTILITHNAVLADIADKVIHIKNGTVSNFILNQSPKNAEEIAW